MVWFEYILDTFHGDAIEKNPRSPKTPSSPKKVDMRRYISEEEGIDLFFYIKKITHDAFYDGCLFNEPDFNSFIILDVINSRRFSATIDNKDHYKLWLNTYKQPLQMIYEYIHCQLRYWGKKIQMPVNLFNKLAYEYSDGFITNN